MRKVGARVPVAVRVSLEEDSAGRMFRCIGSNGERGGEVGEVENGFREEEVFEGVEGSLT